MREASKDKTRLEHIVQAIERIKRYTNGKRFDECDTKRPSQFGKSD